MVYLLGLPLGIKKIIGMGAINDKHIALSVGTIKCLSKALGRFGFEKYAEITITKDLGIVKNKNFNNEANIESKISNRLYVCYGGI